MTKASRWLTTRQAADLLGVKPETVYAYVSRGALTRQRGEDRRSSRFDRIEVERLAARHRRGGRAGALEVVIDTELTMLDPVGALYYRGHDAIELARTTHFEDVAELLWDVAPAKVGRRRREGDWQARAAAVRVARQAQNALPASARPIDRMRVIVAALAACDPLRDDRRPEAVVAATRGLIAATVDALPERTPPQGSSIASRLWSRLSDRPARRGEIRALDAALVLLADHELPASTLAARVAASVWADPYLVVLTGLATGGGVLHAASVTTVETLVREAAEDGPSGVAQLVGDRLRGGERLPGFGHAVYTGRDPRADALLDLVRRAGPKSAVDASVAELLALAGRYDGPAPNVDFGLGTYVVKAGLTPGSGEAIFLLARVVGMIAHALEEYPHRLRFRPRALYTGPAPK
ncbi:citrate synthase [Actinopolymorpha sp. B11F2]|uniref:citrate synthase n=1 Tax=Actinopolymorpha sp. B11F2 TaxID=3160862 RepID=UPI0032E52D69